VKAAIYLRQSLDQNGEGTAVGRQEEDARALISHKGWSIEGAYVDNDMSAAGKRTRPGFEAALEALGAGRADAIVAWSLDRLTRNARDRLRLIEVGRERGAVVALVRGSDLDMSTPAGRLTADILGSVAQHEIEQKSDRQRRANLQLAESGAPPPGGNRSFGYSRGGMEIVDAEAAEIRKAADALIAGASILSIARDWNERGVRTSTGGTWRNTEVRSVLAHPRNAALRVYRGEIIGKGSWPPILDEATYYAVKAVLADPERHKAGPPRRYLLSGLGLCGVCGARLFGVTNKQKGKAHRYRCETRKHIDRGADAVDEFVEAVVIARLARPDAAELFARPDRSEEVGKLREEETALRTRLDGLGEAYALGEIDRRQLSAGTKRLRARLEEITDTLAAAVSTPAVGEIVTADDVRAAWEGLDLDRKRAVIDTLMTIKVHPPGRGARSFDESTVEIVWRL
jgi:site-specific DNA recombinase